MQFLLYGIIASASVATANPLFRRAQCNADNCARAVTGTNRQVPPLETRRAQCAAFLADAAIGSAISTETVTVTPVVTITGVPGLPGSPNITLPGGITSRSFTVPSIIVPTPSVPTISISDISLPSFTIPTEIPTSEILSILDSLTALPTDFPTSEILSFLDSLTAVPTGFPTITETALPSITFNIPSPLTALTGLPGLGHLFDALNGPVVVSTTRSSSGTGKSAPTTTSAFSGAADGVPAYASACSGTVRYSSACACFIYGSNSLPTGLPSNASIPTVTVTADAVTFTVPGVGLPGTAKHPGTGLPITTLLTLSSLPKISDLPITL